MANTIEFDNLVENEVFDDGAGDTSQLGQRPTSLPQSIQKTSTAQKLDTVEGTPLRDRRKKFAYRAEGLRTIILAFTVISFGLTITLIIEVFIGSAPIAPRGGVSSSSIICSNIGIEILTKGGNAVDAAIGTMLCIGVVRPQSAGLGGGGLMIIHDHKTHDTAMLDFRETAPRLLPRSMTKPDNMRKGGRAVGVPGELAGMFKAHTTYGSLAWAEIFIPVIKLAETGWQLDKKDEKDVTRRKDDLNDDSKWLDQFRKTFVTDETSSEPDGSVVRRRKDLANVLRRIAQDGPEDFYNGALAKEIVETVNKSGGVMTEDDLKNYGVVSRDMLMGSFKKFKILTFPAPSSGSLLISMLNDIENLPDLEVGSAEYYVKVAEITARAYRCRALLGDPNDADVKVHEQMLINKTIEHDYCEKFGGAIPAADRGTSHINVIDKNELMVSVTSSLNYWFGSLVMTPSGILLNNEMADFDQESDSNRIVANNRPLSSMVPTIVYHESRPCAQRILIGATNGTRIPSSVMQTLVHLLVKGDSLKDSVEAPKIFCTNSECVIEQFPRVDDIVPKIMEQTQLRVSVVDDKVASVSLLVKMNSTVDGYTESSSYGKAVVF